jgi:5-methylthioadenosine/S-adenosylhomocysteine deaminase
MAVLGSPQSCDLLVHSGHLVTMEPSLGQIPDGALAIIGGRIAAIGATADLRAAWQPRAEINASGAIVHPGFIDAHYHTGLHISRGVLSDRLRVDGATGPSLFKRWNESLSDQDEHASASVACVEMVRHGYTTFMEPGTAFTPDAVAAAAQAVGVRAIVADPHLRDIDDGPNGPPIARLRGGYERALRLLGGQLRRNRDPDALVTGHVAIYGVGTGSLELMKTAKSCADANGAVFAMHQSFAPDDHRFDVARLGGPPMVRYAEHGLLAPNSTFTHLNFLDPAEVAAMSAADATAVWHPGNAMYYGFAPQAPFQIGNLDRAGATIALGNDVAKAWTFGDLPLIGYLLARQCGDFIGADRIVGMLTTGGAKAIGRLNDLGTLMAGKRADLVIARTDEAIFQPGTDTMLHLGLIARGRTVDTVIVNGTIVVRGGRCTQVDEADVSNRAHMRAAALARRLDVPLRSVQEAGAE